jgi:F-type H+-transporting ATPase subunit epsilon
MPIEIEIVSPDRLLLSRPVDMAVVPGTEGDIAAMPGTAPIIVALRGGTIRLFEGQEIVERLFVAGGFAEITPERCIVLADEAVPVAELSREATAERLQRAEAAYEAADKKDMFVVDHCLDALQSARAQVEAAA